MIEFYIDGSTKDNTIGAGIVKVNEFGFIEKHHFNVEHNNPSSSIAEGYALEKTLDMIRAMKSALKIIENHKLLINL